MLGAVAAATARVGDGVGTEVGAEVEAESSRNPRPEDCTRAAKVGKERDDTERAGVEARAGEGKVPPARGGKGGTIM